MSAEAVCEHVRQRLGFQIVAELRRPDGSVPLLQLDPAWEETFIAHEIEGERGQADIALPPDAFNRLVQMVSDKIGRSAEAGAYPGIVTSVKRRRFLRTVLAAKGILNPVLSYEELGTDARPALLGLVPT
jgi:flagellar biosynthesis protein FlhA